MAIAAAFAAMAVGVMLLLLAYGGIGLSNWLAELMRGLPYIGGGLSDFFSNHVAKAFGIVLSWAEWAISGVIEIVSAPIHWLSVNDRTAAYFSGQTADAVNALTDGAATAIGRINAWMGKETARFGTYLIGLPSAVAIGLAGALGVTWIRDHQVPQAQQAAESHAGAYTDARVNASTTAWQGAVASARHQALADLNHERDRAIGAEGAIDGHVTQVERGLTRTIDGIEANVRTIEDVQIRGIDETLTEIQDVTIPQVRAESKAATEALAATVAAEGVRLDCLDPLCSSGFSGLIGSLAAGAELLLLLEFMGQAIRDPQGATGAVVAIGREVQRDATVLVSPFTGAL